MGIQYRTTPSLKTVSGGEIPTLININAIPTSELHPHYKTVSGGEIPTHANESKTLSINDCKIIILFLCQQEGNVTFYINERETLALGLSIRLEAE